MDPEKRKARERRKRFLHNLEVTYRKKRKSGKRAAKVVTKIVKQEVTNAVNKEGVQDSFQHDQAVRSEEG